MVRPIKSAGWRFHGKTQTRLILYTGTPVTAADLQNLNDLYQQVTELDSEDTSVFLNVLPPVEQLVRQIPFSLRLIEALYEKCELDFMPDFIRPYNETMNKVFELQAFASESFPSRQLASEQLFCQLLWWTAYSEQSNYNMTVGRSMPTFQEIENSAKTLLNILSRQCPDLIERAQSDCKQLALCLESLGCHGLVNCSSGLIRMDDAVYLEVQRHGEKMKSLAVRVRDVAENKPSVVDPSSASHQRQMSLPLSEILDRLNINESMEVALEEATTNLHLNSLLRIVRKRVSSDRLLVGLFNAFTRAAPDEFAFEQLDPIVAKLIVIFHGAYQKLLSFTTSESVSTSSCCSDNSNSIASGSINSAVSQPNNRFEQRRIRSKSCNSRIEKKTDLFSPRESHPSETSKSSHSLTGIHSPTCSRSSFDSEESTMLRAQVTTLKAELSHALRQISFLRDEQQKLPLEPNIHDDIVNQILQISIRYSALYETGKTEVFAALSELPEFAEEKDVILKTIFSCIVLTHRSVLETICSKMEKINNILCSGGEENSENEEEAPLDRILLKSLHRKAKRHRGMLNAKEVVSQLWIALYDFPSLKTCTIFNRFVLECCDMSWDIVAGIEGLSPRLRLEYETNIAFDDSLHVQLNPCKVHALPNVRQVIWPALVDVTSGACLVKAVVIA